MSSEQYFDVCCSWRKQVQVDHRLQARGGVRGCICLGNDSRIGFEG